MRILKKLNFRILATYHQPTLKAQQACTNGQLLNPEPNSTDLKRT